ncbi:type II toxin-antitoxin system YhaV family toxin [Methylosinus sp. H3A]|uniref:type II toxin-antitoxin system YhaV family toxin n=1 Tax=Methylosinus sp. H3A TaxID=2785786 RepID=UPI0018C210E5|nr:type II toxin-antitoxin system YhaV family toxin [Methylosinus sp. H3A]MBG0807956.1 type II toxin-antitoxin system YhaV family toxin [Methylosinus sp. H3A]
MNDDILKINGWTIYAHPLFLDQLEAMIKAVEKAREKDAKGYKKKRAAKLLAAVLKVAFENIPSDPTREIYRQGATLGDEYKHWFRAKFLQQFRLFFRYQQSANTKVIVLAWVNDDSTLRAYESANDAYAVFRKMLIRGNPPDSWTRLLAAASDIGAKRRIARATRERSQS